MISFNNKLVLEPYVGDNKIRADVKSGFAKISQKGTLVGLKLLANAEVVYAGSIKELKKGSTLFFEEETLHTHSQYKKTYECKEIKEKFVLGNFAHVSFVG